MVLWGTWQQHSHSCLVCKPLQRAHTLLRALWRHTCDSWGLHLKRHFKLDLGKNLCSSRKQRAGGRCSRHNLLSVDSVENEWQTHQLKTAAPQQEPRPRPSLCSVVQPKVQPCTQTSRHVFLGMKWEASAREREEKLGCIVTNLVDLSDSVSTSVWGVATTLTLYIHSSCLVMATPH